MTEHDTERGEPVAAMQQMATIVDWLLELTEMMIKALESGVQPSHEQIADLREQAALWRQQLDRVRQRLAGVTIEPPSRPQ